MRCVWFILTFMCIIITLIDFIVTKKFDIAWLALSVACLALYEIKELKGQ